MADVVNPQVVDSVTSANLKNLGDAPAMAIAAIYQAFSQSLAMGMQNAVASQQRFNEIANAAAGAALKDLTSVDPKEAVSIAKEMSIGTDLASVVTQLGTALGAVQQFVKTAQSTPPETATK